MGAMDHQMVHRQRNEPEHPPSVIWPPATFRVLGWHATRNVAARSAERVGQPSGMGPSHVLWMRLAGGEVNCRAKAPFLESYFPSPSVSRLAGTDLSCGNIVTYTHSFSLRTLPALRWRGRSQPSGTWRSFGLFQRVVRSDRSKELLGRLSCGTRNATHRPSDHVRPLWGRRSLGRHLPSIGVDCPRFCSTPCLLSTEACPCDQAN